MYKQYSLIETLIEEVEKRPVLWNKWNLNRKNRVLCDKEWRQIAKVLQVDKDEVKAKWRTLRHQFNNEMKKVEYTGPNNKTMLYNGKWKYFLLLSFLIDSTTRQRKTVSNRNLPQSRTEALQLEYVSDDDEVNNVDIVIEVSIEDSESSNEDESNTDIDFKNSM